MKKKDTPDKEDAIGKKEATGSSKFQEDVMKMDEKLAKVKVEPMKLSDMEDLELERMILYGESGSGKTRFYLGVAEYLKSTGIKAADFLMCILNTDRDSGVSKLSKYVPKEFKDRVMVYTVNCYEELVRATQDAVDVLHKHYDATRKRGWLVCELLDENWMHSQDYYIRTAYGETLGFYFAKRRQDVLSEAEDPEKAKAYDSLRGWGDWPIIKYFHNYYWIDRVKRLPFNLIFTAEAKELSKEEKERGSVFMRVGMRPAGEKDNIHRVDSVIHLKHADDKGDSRFVMRALKLTGYEKLFGEVDITGKNGYEEYLSCLKKLDKMGLKTGKPKEMIKQIEEEKKEEKKTTAVATPNVESFEKKEPVAPKTPKEFKLEL